MRRPPGPLKADKPAGPVTRVMLVRIASAFRPSLRPAAAVVVLIAAAAVLGIFPPLFVRHIIDEAIPRHRGSLLDALVAAMILLPLLSSLLGVAQTYLHTVIGQRVMFDLRSQMYASLRRQGPEFFTGAKAVELAGRMTSDATGVAGAATSTIAGAVDNALTVVVTVVAMLVLSPSLTFVSLAMLPLFVYPARRVGRLRRDLAAKRQSRLASLSNVVEETLGRSGIALVKTFGRDRYEEERFADESKQLMDAAVRESVIGRWYVMVIQTFWAAAPALVWLIGGHKAIAGPFSVGSIVAFTAYQARLFAPVTRLVTVHVDIRASLAEFERIFECLDLAPDVAERPGAIDRGAPEGRVTFDSVSIADRADVPVLRGVSFEAEPGTMTALVGHSGAGKSTIAGLVFRLYDPSEGAVRFDSVDVRELTLSSVAGAVGVVSEDTFLFHSSIWDNLAYARPGATMEEVEAAARAAHIHELIAALPESYQTVVGEAGHRLSGGERQRLAIARALLKDPRILVLDEATNDLDTRSEPLIRRAVSEVLRGRTSIVIAHRLSTVLAADQILVVDAGRIAERGTHAELLRRDGLYARLYRERFSAEPRLADILS